VAIAFAREGANVVISYLNEDEDARDTAKWVEEAGRLQLSWAFATGHRREIDRCLPGTIFGGLSLAQFF
jgi:NAD(P)-dependent dehydrogenase (short-subunit alcohol dehydrogenase family)